MRCSLEAEAQGAHETGSGYGVWVTARAIYKDMKRQIEQELLNIPRRFQFIGALRPLTEVQVQSIMRLIEALRFHRRSSFALSNIRNM
jgi:hypothetical protein